MHYSWWIYAAEAQYEITAYRQQKRVISRAAAVNAADIFYRKSAPASPSDRQE